MILHIPNQLNIWSTSLHEAVNNIRKQSNLHLTMLKTINRSKNDVSSQIRVKKGGLHLRPQLNN